jgi:predicted nuclease of predicted toxin-antitoxin system
MKLLLDQGLPLSAAALLRDAGIDTIHVGEIGMSEAKDSDIIRRARNEERIVATLDADFHTILALDAAHTPSVIRIRIERLRAQALKVLLLGVIAECKEDLEQGAALPLSQAAFAFAVYRCCQMSSTIAPRVVVRQV